jgi:hypothetical protein
MAALPARVLVLLLLACGSCASFRGGKLEQLPRDEIASQPRLPAISYQYRSGGEPGSPEVGIGWPSPSAEMFFCSAFTDARRGPAANDLHVDLVHFTEVRQPIFSLTLGLLTLVSLGIIPTYVEEDVTLRARVEYRGAFVREYVYSDRVDTWIELLLIPWAFSHDPVEVERASFENLLLHFLRDLRRDLPQIVPPS